MVITDKKHYCTLLDNQNFFINCCQSFQSCVIWLTKPLTKDFPSQYKHRYRRLSVQYPVNLSRNNRLVARILAKTAPNPMSNHAPVLLGRMACALHPHPAEGKPSGHPKTVVRRFASHHWGAKQWKARKTTAASAVADGKSFAESPLSRWHALRRKPASQACQSQRSCGGGFSVAARLSPIPTSRWFWNCDGLVACSSITFRRFETHPPQAAYWMNTNGHTTNFATPLR